MPDKISLTHNGICLDISCKLRRSGVDSLVFIHGLGICKECFDDVWDYPGYERHSILTFDLPGFGESSRPRDFSYSMRDQAEVAQLLLQELGLGQVHVIGHSMGGAIGLFLAEAIKPLLKSFICLEGNLVGEDCTCSRIAAGYSQENFLNEGFRSIAAKFAKNDKKLFADCILKSDPYGYYRSSQSLVELSDSGSLLDMFLNLDAPKYYIYGERNQNAAVIQKLSSIPKIMIPDAGHGMMTDNPAVFYEKLLGIL